MAFCAYSKKGEVKVKYKERKVPYISKMYVTSTKVCIFLGEFHCTIDKINSLHWIDDIERLNEIHEVFSIIELEKDTGNINFASSKYGLTQLYYYHKDETFAISDDFWEIVNLISPEFTDVDVEGIKESINGCFPLFNNTYLKEVHIVIPAEVGRFNSDKNSLKIDNYFDFKYEPNKDLSLEVACQNLDKSINHGIAMIKKEMGNIKYSFGLSGGLDSRIIPYYLNKNSLTSESFIIGKKSPHFFWLSQDYRNARKLAKINNIKHCECRWDKEIFKKTVITDIKNNPLGTPQFFKNTFDLKVDVLISGGNGYLVGSTIPNNIDELSSQQLANELRMLGREFIPNSHLNLVIEKAFKIILKKEIHLKSKNKYFKFFTDENIEISINQKFLQYIRERLQKGKTNFDIYEEYFHTILGARNKFGGFESLGGRARSFSIYLPHVFDETLQWPQKFLEDRTLLKYLIMKKIPEVSNVKEQKYEGKIIENRNCFIKRIWNIFEYFIRGNGTDMVLHNFKKVNKFFLQSFSNDNKWFYNIFPIKGLESKIIKMNNKSALMKIWKCKLVLDTIETHMYSKYIDDSQYISIASIIKNVERG